MNETQFTETAQAASDALWPSLHSPQWLWLLPVVLVAFGLLLLLAHRSREQALSSFAAPRLLGSLLGSLSRTRRAFKTALVLIGAAIIVFALARPQYGYRWSESRSRGIDIVFVLDTSRSMLATDIKPDRLQRAKLAILDFVDELQGDRIGLVAFAGDAFVQCPLTLDYHVFEQSLEAVNTDIIPIGGTDFAKAITVAEDAFAKDNNHKILIMLTDGEDLEGQGLKRAKEAAANGVTIFTVGVGTQEGSLIPVSDRFGRQDYLRDDNGQQVITRLEADTLNNIAEVTGGFYVPLGSTGEGLQTVYHDGLQSFEKQELSSQMKREGIERFQWPLGLAILLLAWEPLISNRRAGFRRALLLFRRKKDNAANTGADAAATIAEHSKTQSAKTQPSQAQAATNRPKNMQTKQSANGIVSVLAALAIPTIAATLTFAPTAAQAQGVSQRQAESLFNRGDFTAAEQAFNQLLETDPSNARARYNLANTLLAQKQYEDAAKAYAQVLANADIALQADAFYNLGLSHYGRGTQSFAGSDPEQTQAQSEQARSATAQAIQTGQQVLAEAARIEELNRRSEQTQQQQAQPSPLQQPQPPTAQTPIHEIPQQAVQQAIQLAEQAKQASDSALESGETFIEKAQAANGLWRRAEADFNSAAELSAGNSTDARHNAEQTQKSIDALSARISQTQRANQAHADNSKTLEALIEELKKLLKEPPQNDQNQDNQQNQDQSDQQQDQQNSQNNDQQQNDQQQNQDNQQSSQNDKQQGQDESKQGQEGQQQENNQQNDNQPEKGDNQQQPADESDKQNESEKPQQDGQQQNQDGQQNPNDQQSADQGERPNEGKQPEQGEQQNNQSQSGNQQQQPQGGEQQQGNDPQDRGGREQAGEQPVDLTDEQAQQLAGSEQATQDQSAGALPEGALQRAGAMSQQEAAGLLDSLQNSGRLLPLSGRGQQQPQQTRPLKNW